MPHGTAGTWLKSIDRGALFISRQLRTAPFQHQLERQAVPDLDIDYGVTEAAELVDENVKFPLQGEVGTTAFSLPARFLQLDRLDEARLSFIARRSTANDKALDYTEAQRLDDFHRPTLIGIHRGFSHLSLLVQAMPG
jgi:hypothetical protein